MPETLEPSATFHRLFTFVSDGDQRNVASVRQTLDALAETVAFNSRGLRPYYESGDASSWLIGTAFRHNPADFGSGDLTGGLQPGVGYIEGYRVQHDTASLAAAGMNSVTFTANKDTYIGVNKDGLFEFQEVDNDDPAPTPTFGYVHYIKIVTDATDIVSAPALLPLFPISTAQPKLYTDGDADLISTAYAVRGAGATLITATDNFADMFTLELGSALSFEASLLAVSETDNADDDTRRIRHTRICGVATRSSGNDVEVVITRSDTSNTYSDPAGADVASLEVQVDAFGEVRAHATLGGFANITCAVEWTGQYVKD